MCSHFKFTVIYCAGKENYENQCKYGKETFQELEALQKTGYLFQGHHHSIEVVCCSDWKAAACIEGSSCIHKYARYLK